MIAQSTSSGIKMICNLYELYHLDSDGKLKPYEYGDVIKINFSLHANADSKEIKQAIKFADGLKKVITPEEAKIFCHSSKVTIIPLI